MKAITESRNSNSFEIIMIDNCTHTEPSIPLPEQTTRGVFDVLNLSPKNRLIALSTYLLISGMSSLYFCLIQAGMESIRLCDTVTSCLFYSSQSWPAMGAQTIDLLVMSYVSGTISTAVGVLGAFGIYAACKESASKVRLFAKTWWIMIGIFIGSAVLTLFLTVIHKEQFLAQCSVEHDAVLGTTDCGIMYAAALLGSLIGCVIGVTMILCYCGDVVRYSLQLENAKQKTQRTDSS